MTAESRVVPVADFLQLSEGEPIRSVVQESPESSIVVWHLDPGQEIAAHTHPDGQDTWTVLCGSAEYLQGNGISSLIKAGEIAIARSGQIHGAKNTGDQPFIFVSVVAPGNASHQLLE
jgi:quercetin dioxygenase-like cupin family protein